MIRTSVATVIASSPNPPAVARLLLVDSANATRAALAKNLRQHNFRVDETASAPEALAWLAQSPFDLMILDTDVAGKSGVEFMTRAREQRRDLLIVVWTAHATVESTIAAIKANVVDYLLKPCRTDDVLLTVTRAVEERAQQLRRQRLFDRLREAIDTLDQPAATSEPMPAPIEPPSPVIESQTSIRAGVLTLDREKRIVTLATVPPRSVELTEGEASVLVALMEKPNQVFTYSQLAKTALGYEGMDKWTVESVIRSTVFRLRHKIEDGADAPQVIRTVRGRGYFFSMA